MAERVSMSLLFPSAALSASGSQGIISACKAPLKFLITKFHFFIY